MNKIVRDHYPASKLPPELREGIPDSAQVQVTIVQEEKPKTREELLAMIEAYRAKIKGEGIPAEEPAARIRALRDEWDDR